MNCEARVPAQGTWESIPRESHDTLGVIRAHGSMTEHPTANGGRSVGGNRSGAPPPACQFHLGSRAAEGIYERDLNACRAQGGHSPNVSASSSRPPHPQPPPVGHAQRPKVSQTGSAQQPERSQREVSSNTSVQGQG
ncbi:hypothetical protein SKAU_G00313750 [Synaphobranchus kaupii]|uniref:Uncharacterized protein n=1 Tax=Synaphobranchus kaupii TaxID=118154 RepID=A0A9Q1ES60_SYNKA|nr:hypothetical protein SKAU_G00313750 [Synaphobranchus kaupii]